MPHRALAITMLALALAPFASAQEAPAPLTREEISAAIEGDLFSLPMPGELFAALDKAAVLDWATAIRQAPAGVFTDRSQIAMNLGTLIADGYLAVEAKDKAQVRRVAQDIKRLAKGVNVQDEIVSRGNSIVEFADEGQWETLREELEATQNEVAAAMIAHKDDELVTLVMLGGWLRGLEVVTASIAKKYTPEAAQILRQPAVVEYFVQKLAKMDPKFTDSPLMNAVRLALFDIKKAVTYGRDATPAAEEIARLAEMSAAVVARISKRE